MINSSPRPKVVILAGGKGTRLRPFTATFPKPLVPLGDKPVLEVILTQLANQGFGNVTLTLGHLSALLKSFVEQSEVLKSRLHISYVDETEPTGTAGSLSLVPDLTDTFMVMNGDLLTDLNYADLLAFHKRSGAALTIAAHRKQVAVDLGVLEADDAGQLQNYLEKPRLDYEVSMGVYVYEPDVLKLIEPGKYLDFPDLVLRLLAQGSRVQLYRNDAFWLDIGRPDDYATAQEIFADNPGRFGI